MYLLFPHCFHTSLCLHLCNVVAIYTIKQFSWQHAKSRVAVIKFMSIQLNNILERGDMYEACRHVIVIDVAVDDMQVDGEWRDTSRNAAFAITAENV